MAGFEADDIIATLATQGRDRGDDVIIVTGDRDTYQLVEDPHVKVLYNKRGVSDYALYDEAGILERTGVTPALYPQYAALRGDPSDNLPGVPGVGEKTAAKLITTYGGIDGIFEHLDEQTPKLRENLAAHEANVRQNAEVMVLVRDVPLEQAIDDARRSTRRRSTSPRCAGSSSSSSSTRCSTGWPRRSTPTSGPSAAEADGARGRGRGRRPTPRRGRQGPRGAGRRRRAARAGRRVGGRGGPLRRSRAWRSSLDGATGDVRLAPGRRCSPTPRCATRSAALAGAGGRPLAAHQAKPLVRALTGLDVDVRSLALDTALAAYLLDPAESRYLLEELRRPLRRRPHPRRRRRGRGPARPRRRRPPRRPPSPAAGPSPSTGWSRRCTPPSTPRACARSTTRSRCRSSACWPAWRTSASASTATSSQRLRDRLVADVRAAPRARSSRRPATTST